LAEAAAPEPVDAQIALLFDLLGPPALLKTEDRDVFLALLRHVFKALAPSEPLDQFDLYSLVKTLWHGLRLERWRVGLLDGAMQDAVFEVITRAIEQRSRGPGDLDRSHRRAGALARGWGEGTPEMVAAVRRDLRRLGLSEAMLEARVVTENLGAIERLGTLIEKNTAQYTRDRRDLEQRLALQRNSAGPSGVGNGPDLSPRFIDETGDAASPHREAGSSDGQGHRSGAGQKGGRSEGHDARLRQGQDEDYPGGGDGEDDHQDVDRAHGQDGPGPDGA
jgi:hypothetical protein